MNRPGHKIRIGSRAGPLLKANVKPIHHSWLIASIALLCACSGIAEKPQLIVGDVAPEILQRLPSNIDGFLYRGARNYPASLGYSLRYRHGEIPDVDAEVLVSPVPQEAVAYSHIERVDLMSMRALREIQTARARGVYADYSIIRSGSFEIDGSYATRTDIALLRDEFASVALLFLTEREGRLLTLRMTMPDNYSNRHHDNWQQFAETVFGLILENIERG